jgi:hypothetical protein
MSDDTSAWFKDWVSTNFHSNPLVDSESYDRHIERLWTACCRRLTQRHRVAPA